METISTTSNKECSKCQKHIDGYLTITSSDDGFSAMFCDKCLVLAAKRFVLDDGNDITS